MYKISEFTDEILKMPLFQGIKAEDMPGMFSCLNANIREYKKGKFVFRDTDEIKYIGVIISGRVQMIREDMWGNKAVLVNMMSPELFGETFASRANTSASVSFQAVEDAIILFLPFERVMQSCSMTCEFHQRIIKNMVTLIADKNMRLMEKIDVMSKKSLREKIAAFLTIQAERHNSKSFEITMGRIELADYLNADRSALTRELNTMQQEGLIIVDKKSFQILQRLE